MDTMSIATGSTPRKPAFRPTLQPRAAAALDFNDENSDSEDEFGLLSADYKAQRKTTLDLVDFFKNAPPPPPAPSLPPLTVDEKKKRTLLQRLRNRRSHNVLHGGSGNRNSLLGGASGTGSSISAAGSTAGTVATLPNGKKYVMIAVDYKDTASGSTTTNPTSPGGLSQISPVTGITSALATTAKRSSPTSSKRHSRIHPDNRTLSITTNGSSTFVDSTNTIDNSKTNSTHPNTTVKGENKQQSITIQTRDEDRSSFILDNTPFLLDNLALDTDIVMPSSGAYESNRASAGTVDTGKQHRMTRSGHSQTTADGGLRKGTNKVKFNIAGQQQQTIEEDLVSKALEQRIANHKAQLLKNQGLLASGAGEDGTDTEETCTVQSPPEVSLPRPISRKKVRHVQIQTQHCIMRPMYTQTEPMESLSQDLEVKEFSTQTDEGCREMATSTELDSLETASIATSNATTAVSAPLGPFAMSTARANSKVATLVASLSQPSTPTTTGVPPPFLSKGVSSVATTTMSTTSTDTLVSSSQPLSVSEQEELALLRQKNAALQAQVNSLQRDLASEMRARTRTAVAMQDTRDKFEMLSAIAYKKIKEMIFQRHVLEMEVRELRAQVDMHAAEDAAVAAAGTVEVSGYGRHHHHNHHGQQHHGGHKQEYPY
ncbi:hypothetical protein FBU30_004591 [Linnemannia zychae]|nr:hypothetical protein FBU30_004591 [Linnemannia zychae]